MITVDANAFRAALATIANVVPSRTTIPILGHIHLAASRDCLTVTSNNLDMQVSIDVPCDGELMACCPNFAVLRGGVATIGDGPIVIAGDAVAGKVTIKRGGAVRTIRTLPPADFPLIASDAGDATIDLPMRDLQQVLRFVLPAISTDASRYCLGGIHLAPRAGPHGNMVVEATDGFQMRRATFTATMVGEVPHALLPPWLARLLVSEDDAGSAIAIALNARQAALRFGRVRIISKLIEGTFPEVDRIIPTANDKLLTVNGEELSRAVLAAVSINPGKVRGVRLALSRDGSVCRARAEDGDDGEEPMADADWQSPPLKIGFNGPLLAGLAKMFGDRPMTVALADAGAPTLFTADALPGALAVLMPMREWERAESVTDRQKEHASRAISAWNAGKARREADRARLEALPALLAAVTAARDALETIDAGDTPECQDILRRLDEALARVPAVPAAPAPVRL